MSDQETASSLITAIRLLREAIAAYHGLGDEEKQSYRHEVYLKTGGFGKIFMKPTLLQEIMDLEDKLGLTDYGRVEDWKSLPLVVRECKHPRGYRGVEGDTTVRCRICKYIYRFKTMVVQ